MMTMVIVMIMRRWVAGWVSEGTIEWKNEWCVEGKKEHEFC